MQPSLALLTDGWWLQKIYDNVEIQHRILEAHPLLASLPGFQEAHGRKLTDKAEVGGDSSGW